VSDECRAGCCPHGGASRLEGCPADLPGVPLWERVAHLRACQLMPVRKIAALTGADRALVTRLLYEAGAGGGPRGPARRMTRPLPPPRRGPSEAELLAALYADAEVGRVLERHGVPVRALAGRPPWPRFPAPPSLTAGLVGDLYEGCGLSLHHIELLTGRPAAAAGAVLRASGVKLRPPGGRSPFTDRWRPGRD